MASRTFDAQNWLAPTTHDLPGTESIGRTFSKPILGKPRFTPSHFLLPGWKGEGLITRSSLSMKNIIHKFQEEVSEQLETHHHFNRSLKLAIYNEFIDFSEASTMDFSFVEDRKSFWLLWETKEKKYREKIDLFKNFYSLKVSIIYLLKIRFITILCQNNNIEYENNDLINPNYFFSRVFPQGSSIELSCESLQSNHYSWYRPSPKKFQEIKALIRSYAQINIVELSKVISGEFRRFQNHKPYFSHSLSDKNFGLFMSLLLVYFPRWLDEKPASQDRPEAFPKTLNCKFVGDYLESIALSHWLSQHENSDKPWHEIICPDFIGEKNKQGMFLKICSEIQFLITLAYIAQKRNYDTRRFISSIFQNKRIDQLGPGQISLFGQCNVAVDKVYDRIVLNLVNFPPNNPHHFLLQKIQREGKHLSENGRLLVFSNKNLFIPSQREKLEQMLSDFKLEGNFMFEELKGRGEICSHLYVFSRRGPPPPKHEKTFSFHHQLKKQPCLSFRLSGQLANFQKYSLVSDWFLKFLKQKKSETPPALSRSLASSLTFDFFQDAIVDGVLINSSNKDKSNITHPLFFNRLMGSSERLGCFLGFESLDHYHDSLYQSTRNRHGLFGMSSSPEDKYGHCFIVDIRTPSDVRIEIVPMESFRAKADEYGHALCHYFGVTPKRKDLNLNLFRTFFESEIGMQIVQQSLVSLPTKIKPKLESVLIPKFFMEKKIPPEHVSQSLGVLSLPKAMLENEDPITYLEKIKSLLPLFPGLRTKYPWTFLDVLSLCKINLTACLDKFKSDHHMFFGNTCFIQLIMDLPTYPLFPENEDIYIEFHLDNRDDIQRPLTMIKKAAQKVGIKEVYSLTLWSESELIAELSTSSEMADFLDYLLKQAIGAPISVILQNIRIPKFGDLKKAINEFSSQKTSLLSVLDIVQEEIKILLKIQLTSQSI